MSSPRDAAFKVAVLDALSKRVNLELADARSAAQPVFAAARTNGATQLEVALPSGAPIGKISIKAGKDVVTVDEDALLAWVKANKPEELEATVSSSALSRPDVVAYVRKLHPDLVGHKIRPAYRTKLLNELTDDGELVNETTGEVVKIREVVKGQPTGEFQMTFESAKNGRLNGRDQIAAAWQSGDLSITDLIAPALKAGES